MRIKNRVLFIVLVLLLVTIVSLSLTASSSASPDNQSSAPVHGWRVCEDLGEGSVPGLGVTRQRFRLCNSGWELLTFCVDPGATPPALGALCSRISENRYWCGDNIQEVEFYQMLQTPAPEPPPTATLTPTATVTYTPTSLPPTPPEDNPPGGGGGGGDEGLPTPQPAPRPQPGGPGNLGFLLMGGITLLGGGGYSLYYLMVKRK
jgi:hypothetical protein